MISKKLSKSKKNYIGIILSIIFLVIPLFLISGYAGYDAKQISFEEEWIVLVAEYTTSDYNKRLIEGVAEEARKNGLRLEVLDANHNKKAMGRMIDDATFRNVGGILISHGSPDLLTPSLKRSLKKNIPVVAIHCDLNLEGVSILSQDDRRISELIINEMISDTNGIADFILIWVDGYDPMIKRMEVYKKMMARHPGLHEITRFGIADKGTALHTEATLKQLLQKHPVNSVDAVLATWDEFAKGAARAIMDSGRPEIRLYGIDISNSVLQMIQDPDNPWTATVGMDSKILGRVQVKMLVHAMRGGTLPQHHSMQPVLIKKSMLPADKPVTMDNLPLFIPDLHDYTNVPFTDTGE